MVNVCSTGSAALKTRSPACEALIVHEPTPVTCTVAPEIVHCPDAAKLTGRPEDAVALTVKSGSPGRWSSSGPNVIVCDARVHAPASS